MNIQRPPSNVHFSKEMIRFPESPPVAWTAVSARQFVHLHFHTCYSLLDGACRVDRTMDLAEEYGMPAVAITDHGVMYGAIDFYKQARKKGIKPLIGCETYVALGKRTDRKTESGRSPMHHLVLLATDTLGYHNLVKLVSAAHLEGFYYKPRIDKELLAEHHAGLIGLSACLKGEVASSLASGRADAAAKVVGEYADIFGKNNFFLEIQDHRLPDQRRVNRHLPGLAAKAGIPLVATNDVHYLKAEHAPAHEVLLAMQTQTVLSDPKRMRYQTNEFYMKNREEMEALFGEIPEVLDRTLDIAERCNVEIEFGRPHFPTFDVPEGMTQREYLVDLCREGLQRLYGISDPAHPANAAEKEIVTRFEHELSVIEHTGYVNYYLVVWDFVHYARKSGIPVGPGRGSGGGSLLAYLLGITALDPLEHGLIFERFLNPERVSPPDFDIDFCQARRGEVISYVKNKYGADHVAQIITFGSLGAKSVIRDVGRVLEVPYARCDQLAKLVPDDPKMTLDLALQMNPDFRRTYETEPDCKRILDYAFVLEGLYRNPGTHAAGVVIGEKPLVEILPLSRDKDKQPITQYTMEPLGEIGLLKMDFLGLKTLTVIRETVDFLRETRGVDVDIENLPMDDPPAYKLLNRGDTVGVFQLESTGMRDLIRRIGIESIRDLIAMIALYRPGPMNMLDDFVNRKAGKTPIRYDHELLEPILEETYGVMLYQEEVMKVANVLAGYSLGQADILRKAMGKKNEAVMEEQRAPFIKGCGKTNKIEARLANKIFDTIKKFAGYGFPKAHSAGYGIIAYQTAYLKANYLAEFMSALISSEIGHFEKLPVFVREAADMGLEILPPDVNHSGERFRPEGKAVRYGLAGIKNVGEGAAKAIIEEREKNGPYSGLVDLCGRIDPGQVNKKVLESLVRSGACDGWQNDRARVYHAVDFAMSRTADALKDKQTGQASLFDLLEGTAAEDAEALPPADPWPEHELLSAEKELLGVYMSGHPLTRYSSLLERYRMHSIGQLGQLPDEKLTRVGGIVALIRKRFTKKKEPMAIVTLEDMDENVQVVVFPAAYQKFAAVLVQDAPVMICGQVSRRDDPPSLQAHEIHPLDDVPRLFTKRVSIHVPVAIDAESRLAELKDILRLYPGTVPVHICLQFPGGEKVFVNTSEAFRVMPEEELLAALHREVGENSVYIDVNRSPCLSPPPDTRKWSRPGGDATP